MAQTKSALHALLASVTIAGLAFPADLAQLTGAANFRDVGGYQTSDGHKIKRHTIYRSGELSGLTTADQRALEELHIRYEVDLRTDKERAESPTRWGKNAPQVVSVSVGESRQSDPIKSVASSAGELRDAAEAKRYMEKATARIAIQGAGDIGEVIRALAKGDEPALIHCTAGKDRTGVTVAVLMTLLGASRDEVDREYLRSNDSVDQQLERMKAREKSGASETLSSLRPEVLRTMLGTERSYMDAAFAAIDTEYGSFDAYTERGLKVTPAQVHALRTNLLEQ
jgi:protein-tyrosine phosphatase